MVNIVVDKRDITSIERHTLNSFKPIDKQWGDKTTVLQIKTHIHKNLAYDTPVNEINLTTPSTLGYRNSQRNMITFNTPENPAKNIQSNTPSAAIGFK